MSQTLSEMEAKNTTSNVKFNGYESVKLYEPADGKWFVGYTLIFPDGSKIRKKERGKAQYDISLTKEKNLKKRRELADTLIDLMIEDLNIGIDPNNAKHEREKRKAVEVAAVQKEQDSRISIDRAIQLTKEAKGWVNPVEGKENTTNSVPSFLTNQFKPYLEKIGKADDVRLVTRKDIKDWIEAHFNAVEGGEYDNWSSSSCSAYKARISILFNVLIDKELVEYNPTTDIKIKSDNEKIIPVNPDDEELDRFEPWTAKEVKHWFEDLVGSEVAVERAMYVSSGIIYYSFIRKSELLRLKAWMVDFENERFTLPPKLTKSARKYNTKNLIHVDIPEELIDILREWFDLVYPNGFTDDDYLLPNLKMKKLTNLKYVYSTFTDHFVKLRKVFIERYKEQGLFIDKNQYALKHTGVQDLFRSLAKTDDTPSEIHNYIQRQCRHSSYDQTETYLQKLKLEVNGKRKKVNFKRGGN